jgi:hypothetical protein
MEGRPQEVAARIAGEDAAGPVAAVRGRRKAEYQDPGVGIAEARERPRPVRLAGEPPWRLARRLLAPRDESRTPNADDDLTLDLRETRGPLERRRRAYLSRSLSSRRETTAMPTRPSTLR